MLLLKMLLFSLLALALPAFAVDPQLQADLLLAKISVARKEGRRSESLAYCATLEKLRPMLERPLPENFDFDYIEVLQGNLALDAALSRGLLYLQRYGQAGAHYRQVAAIVNELQQEARKTKRDLAAAVAIARGAADRAASEVEQEQALGVLRACQGAALDLERKEAERSDAFAALEAQSASLRQAQEALDQRAAEIKRLGPGRSAAAPELGRDLNNDVQSYNDAVRDFSVSREFFSEEEEKGRRAFAEYEGRCSGIEALAPDFAEVCQGSDDWFCRGGR